MTIEITIVLAVFAAAVVLFATERVPVDLVALLVMGTLLVSGILSADEAIAGFSNTATVTVGAMLVLSAGLFRTGAVNQVGVILAKTARFNFSVSVLALMITVAVISAFINNTAAVAIFLPVVLALSRDAGVSPSKILIPLSFAGIFGGMCTLIGTSTNILVDSIAVRHGQPAFGLFELTPLGLIFLLSGTLYMIVIGIRLLPERRRAGDLTQNFDMTDYLVEVVLLPESTSVGRALGDSPIVRDLDLDVLEVVHEGERFPVPRRERVLKAGDSLHVRCDVEKIKALQERVGIALKPHLKLRDKDLQSERAVLVEAVVAPNSPLVGRTLKEARFRNAFGATVLAIRHLGALLHEQLVDTILQAGDVLLVEVRIDRLNELKATRAFVMVNEVDVPEFRKNKVVPAVAIIVGVVLLAAFNVMPIVASAIIGCVLMILARCITLEEAYQAVDWRVIFLLAGVLTLGVALEKTGAALLISTLMVDTIGAWGPYALISAFYLLTSILTNAMSNNAAAALLAPIAIVSAESLKVDPRPFLMAVTFAASAAFMTPVGYQTNTLVHGPGQYRFRDWMKVGTPLNIIFWILASLLIPRIWPL